MRLRNFVISDPGSFKLQASRPVGTAETHHSYNQTLKVCIKRSIPGNSDHHELNQFEGLKSRTETQWLR